MPWIMAGCPMAEMLDGGMVPGALIGRAGRRTDSGKDIPR
jgi:hypothetical protein